MEDVPVLNSCVYISQTVRLANFCGRKHAHLLMRSAQTELNKSIKVLFAEPHQTEHIKTYKKAESLNPL